MEIVGNVKMIGTEQQVSQSFKKRELVVTTEEQYPQHILIEFAQDKTDLLNGLILGDHVKVKINLRGREWVNPQGETKYFNSIQGWKIDKTGQSPSVTVPTSSGSAVDAYQKKHAGDQFLEMNKKEEEHDDLPF